MSYWIADEFDFLETKTLVKTLGDDGGGNAKLTITIGEGQDVNGPFLIRIGSSWTSTPSTNFHGFRAVDRVNDYLQTFDLIAQADVANFENGQRVFEHYHLLGFQSLTDTLATSVDINWDALTGFTSTPVGDTAYIELIPFRKHKD